MWHSMTLAVRPLGSSGLEISAVGLGTWAIGGGDWAYGWGSQDDRVSLLTMRRAVDAGINWIDTAAVYGLGHSELVVGRFLRDLPSADRPLIFTKCGLLWDERDRHAPFERYVRSLRPASIRCECEASLRRLGVEQIDLYQFHWSDQTGTPIVREGKVRYGGVSNFDVPLLERCAAIRHVDSFQPAFSLIRREVAGAELPWCGAHGTGVLCYSALQSGLLTDSFSQERIGSLAQDDWRRQAAEFQEPLLSPALTLRDALRPIAGRHGVSVSAVAVAWTIAWPGVTGAIVGARAPQQIDGWIDAARLTLTKGDLDEIAAAIAVSGAGAGPSRQPD
jgi:aryl-alcohol dehydrogenase-like predicted oxidoreductase